MPETLCPLRAMTGVPCPFCGMTRGVLSVVQGDLGHAIALNPGSVALVALVLAGALLYFTRGINVTKLSLRPAWIATVVLAMWAYQLAKYTTGRPL